MDSAANIKIVFDAPGLGWCLISKGSAKLLFAGTVLGIDENGLLRLLQLAHSNLDAVTALVQQFKGHFGIVYQDERKIVAVTDCIASYPIFYRSFDHVCNIATSANALAPFAQVHHVHPQVQYLPLQCDLVSHNLDNSC